MAGLSVSSVLRRWGTELMKPGTAKIQPLLNMIKNIVLPPPAWSKTFNILQDSKYQLYLEKAGNLTVSEGPYEMKEMFIQFIQKKKKRLENWIRVKGRSWILCHQPCRLLKAGQPHPQNYNPVNHICEIIRIIPMITHTHTNSSNW